MTETTINLIKAMLDNEEVYREACLAEAEKYSGNKELANEVLQDVRNAIKEFNEFCATEVAK